MKEEEELENNATLSLRLRLRFVKNYLLLVLKFTLPEKGKVGSAEMTCL